MVTPALLGAIFVTYLLRLVSEPYGGYPPAAQWLGGWLVLLAIAALGFVLERLSRSGPADPEIAP